MRIPSVAAVSVIALSAAHPALAQSSFERIASFPVVGNLPEGTDPATPTSPEIIDATLDGMTLIYSDSPLGAIGFIDITDPAAPQPGGAMMLDGEPTAVAILGNETAFVGVNTSESFTAPSGRLTAIDIASRSETSSCDLGGQPDSVAVAPDGNFVAVAVENERDEDLNDGVIPQLPAGFVAIVPLADGVMQCDGLIRSDVTGLADIAPEDPEPEFVDINAAGEIAVTLQENNHIVILGGDGSVLSHFSAGAVDLEDIDTEEDGALVFTGSQPGRLREPDAIQWIDADHVAIANEGDYEGGSRGFTIFTRDGSVVYEDGTGFEQAAIEAGHYPEARSGSKGIEPEGMEFARFGDAAKLFVMAERASLVGVYELDGTTPTLAQILPSGIGPEGIKAIPGRNLIVTANETDLVEDGGVRAHVMIYELRDGAPSYPSITSAGAEALIGWGALRAWRPTPKRLAGSSRSTTASTECNRRSSRSTPRRSLRASPRPSRSPEEASRRRSSTSKGSHPMAWAASGLASEGHSDQSIPHAIYHVDGDGSITDEIAFPAELLAGETRFGAEGITVEGPRLWVAIQREWGGDPEDHAKLVAYDLETEDWGAVLYPKARVESGWVGLSEITTLGDWVYVVERDNQIGDAASIKKLYRVPLSEIVPAPLGGALPVVSKEEVHDFLPDLAAPGGYIVDKLEGFTVDAAGEAYAVTDNDGVDDSSGETHFLRLGPLEGL